MKIHLYALCWNEIRMLPYFFRHYDPFVDQYTILDNGSTDGSAEYLARYPKVRLGSFEVTGDSFVLEAQRIYNEIWKESRGHADWVIVCNIDEHFYHSDISGYLRTCASRGITAVPSLGHQMVAREYPEGDLRLCETLRRGVRAPRMDKLSIFNPDKVREINFEPGRHMAHPEGEIVYPAQIEVLLFHYKYLGLDYLMARSAELGARLKKADIAKDFGRLYFWDKKTLTNYFDHVWDHSTEIQNPVEPWKPRSSKPPLLERFENKTRRLLKLKSKPPRYG